MVETSVPWRTPARPVERRVRPRTCLRCFEAPLREGNGARTSVHADVGPGDSSSDDLICAHQQRLWNLDPERPCGWQIDCQLEFGRLLDRHLSG